MQASEVVKILNGYQARCKPISFDIEGFCNWVTCYSIADSKDAAIVVPLILSTGESVWSEDDEIAIWQATKELLEDVHVPKILQNYLYDAFVLLWSFGIVIGGLEDDTMLGHFENYAELEKSLGFQASIYTREPFYKSERKSTDEKTQFVYCGKDACVTFECNDAIKARMLPKQFEHYKFNVSLLAPLLFMEARGIRYDKAAAERRLAEVRQQIYEKQDEINREASTSREPLKQFYTAIGGCNGSLLDLFTTTFCRARRTEQRKVEETTWQPMRWNGKKWVKKGKRVKSIKGIYENHKHDAYYLPSTEAPTTRVENTTWLVPITQSVTRNVPVTLTTLEDVQRFALNSRAADCRRACAIVRESALAAGGFAPGARGELAGLLGVHVKINSTSEGGDAQWFLYEHCQLPKQFAKEGNKLTTKLSSDDEAVIKAYLASGKDDASRDKRALLFLKMRKLVTESKTLAADCDPDGRIRCGYNLVGTDTHRLACYESPTGSGYNLQTVTKSHRDLFVADEGCWLCQRDLAGADGFSVAAYSAMLGDHTMLDDYAAKLKPAQIIVLMLADGAGINQLSRDELRPRCKAINEETHWQYFAMKRVQHGSSYGMGKNTMSSQILTDSFKKDGTPIYLSPADCERIQNTCFFIRYPGIKLTHEWMAREIKSKGVLTASNGFSRKFYGRKDDNATVRAALGHLPQVMTTYATTLAVSRLWTDPENQRQDGSLIVEPLHTVHDSLITQWQKADTAFAKVKMLAWFENPLQIATETLTIPASGSYGPNWKEQSYEL